VTGAFILYPGDSAVVFPANNATRMYEGVGVLPLKPDAGARPTQLHLDNIKQIIEAFILQNQKN